MRHVLSICAGSVVLLAAACGEGSRIRSVAESVRSALNTPIPPDTIPEMVNYAADLQVDMAGMAKLPEGVFWIDLESGSGEPAVVGDSVEIGYRGWLSNGTIVDSGVVSIRIGESTVVPGLELGLPGMKPGGKRKLVLPPGLAYGGDGRDDIPPYAVLVYDVVLRGRFP
jgi:hypothetical protein